MRDMILFSLIYQILLNFKFLNFRFHLISCVWPKNLFNFVYCLTKHWPDLVFLLQLHYYKITIVCHKIYLLPKIAVAQREQFFTNQGRIQNSL